MAFKKIVFLSMVLFMIGSITAPLRAQMTEQEQKAMEAYMKAMAVTDNHKALEFFAGDWEVKSTMWTMPGMPPSGGGGTGGAEMILGGRFVMMRFKGTMMGQPFEGLQIVGYDNINQKYVTFWIDNSSTAFFLMTGTRDPDTKIFNDGGLWPDPLTGGTSKVRASTRVLGPDEYLYEMFMVMPDGSEFKSLENMYSRKK